MQIRLDDFPGSLTMFERTIATAALVGSSLFLVLALTRLRALRKSPLACKVGPQAYLRAVSDNFDQYKTPLMNATQLLSVLIAISTLATSSRVIAIACDFQQLLVASCVLALLSSITLLPLSWLEYRRSIYPSDLIVVYLMFCIVRDGFQIVLSNTLYSRDVQFPFIAQIILQIVMLVVESFKKDLVRTSCDRKLSTEETSGVIARYFFWWINPILIDGYHNVLRNTDLPSVDSALSSLAIREATVHAWHRRSKLICYPYSPLHSYLICHGIEKPESSLCLPKVLFECFKKPILWAIIPRLFLIVFRYAQPLLIREAIGYVSASKISSARSWSGPDLIVAAMVVYFCLAVSLTIIHMDVRILKPHARLQIEPISML